jgi:hypothetical protein
VYTTANYGLENRAVPEVNAVEVSDRDDRAVERVLE